MSLAASCVMSLSCHWLPLAPPYPTLPSLTCSGKQAWLSGQMRAGDIMTRDPICAKQSCPPEKVISIMLAR
jgi:hypothetical protein